MKRENFSTQSLSREKAAIRFLGNQEFVKVKALGQDTLMVISHL